MKVRVREYYQNWHIPWKWLLEGKLSNLVYFICWPYVVFVLCHQQASLTSLANWLWFGSTSSLPLQMAAVPLVIHRENRKGWQKKRLPGSIMKWIYFPLFFFRGGEIQLKRPTTLIFQNWIFRANLPPEIEEEKDYWYVPGVRIYLFFLIKKTGLEVIFQFISRCM